MNLHNISQVTLIRSSRKQLRISIATLQRFFMPANATESHIKKETYYKEREAFKREEFNETLQRFRNRAIVYVDESGIDEYD